MRTFEKFNGVRGHQCPICGKNTEEETILVGIEGTNEGNNMQAAQVHTKCLQEELRLMESSPGTDMQAKGFIVAQCYYPYRHATTEETKET